jgi:replicative DNA helicase
VVIALPEPRDRTSPAGETGQVPDEQENHSKDTPPTDVAAERACAGALLLAPPELAQPVVERLRDDDLADMRCRFVVTTVRRMLAEDVPPDPVTFAAFVERHALLEPGPARVHLRSWLAELASTAPVVASLGHYADAVVRCAARRRMHAAGGTYQRVAVGTDLDELAEVARSEYLAVADALDRAGATVGRVSADV